MSVVQCDECNTKFNVEDARLRDGRTVRCTECQNTWFQEPENDNDAAADLGFADHVDTTDGADDIFETEVDTALPDSINRVDNPNTDTLTIEDDEDKGTSNKMAVVVFVGLVTTFFGVMALLPNTLIQTFPKTKNFYDMVGIHVDLPWDGLRFTKGYATYRAEADIGTVLYVEADIQNINPKSMDLPRIEVALMNAENAAPVQTWTPEPEDITLKSGDLHQVKLGFTDFVKDRGYIRLSFTNNTE